MIVVTHELNFAANFASRIIFMDQGAILEDGDKDEVLKHPKTERLQQFLSKIN